MKVLFQLFFITLAYYQSDNILQSCVYNSFDIFKEEPIIFYPNIKAANIFIFFIFIILFLNLCIFSKNTNYTIISMSFIYLKYLMDTIFNNNIGLYQYEFKRTLMWLFTTPLILKLYCDMNRLSFIQINSHYHVICNILHILLFNFRKTFYNNYIILILSAYEGYFIYNLFYFKHQKYTMFIIYIWILFSLITIIEITNIFNIHDIQICYLFSDMIAKITIILIVNDYEEQTDYIKNNIDLQSITLLTLLKKTIKQFEKNSIITSKCKMMINVFDNKISSFIPIDTTSLKLELLKKILPFELEEDFLTQNKEYKQFDFICVLFIDIVSYTELAKEYDAEVIYNLLNDIYTRFDEIINRYGNLQKIETIGDAYMVVSDIFTNDSKNNVKNMILFAFDLMKAVKNIPTPNNKPLQLRIGINLGTVVVGILGVEIPRLCVIGNTVNVANRLQTNTEPNTIQISTHVHEIIAEIDFGFEVNFERKDNVFLKNLGSRTTYIINPPF